mmetsp:Transcript_36363/g.92912  ORF Transcript_36363/g.92912 Transcript_36363/m.92912 type:complete len:305 (+) Transcript_36363:627-1541(+)
MAAALVGDVQMKEPRGGRSTLAETAAEGRTVGWVAGAATEAPLADAARASTISSEGRGRVKSNSRRCVTLCCRAGVEACSAGGITEKLGQVGGVAAKSSARVASHFCAGPRLRRWRLAEGNCGESAVSGVAGLAELSRAENEGRRVPISDVPDGSGGERSLFLDVRQIFFDSAASSTTASVDTVSPRSSWTRDEETSSNTAFRRRATPGPGCQDSAEVAGEGAASGCTGRGGSAPSSGGCCAAHSSSSAAARVALCSRRRRFREGGRTGPESQGTRGAGGVQSSLASWRRTCWGLSCSAECLSI